MNQIDNLFDGILNNLNIYLDKKKFFKTLNTDVNFVKFQNTIIDVIKDFTNKIIDDDLKAITTNKKHITIINEYIKRYCAYYIFLGIAYYYEAGRDLYITNILETSNKQKISTYKIVNFFNSENNAKLVNFFVIIENINKLLQFKTLDKVKIILQNSPINYATTIDFFNLLGEDFVVEYILVSNNFHNLIKTLIFRKIYLAEDKENILNIINEEQEEEGEYKYIDVILSKKDKLIDYLVLKNFFTSDELQSGLVDDVYEYLKEYKENSDINVLTNAKIIDFLFSNKILIPITEDYLRYHKDTYKYDKNIDNLKERDATKIKFIINVISKMKNLYSDVYKKNPKLILSAQELFYKQLKERDVVLYNDDEEINIINKLENSQKSTDLDYILDLENIRNYNYLNYKDFSKDGFRLRTTNNIEGVRYSGIKHKSKSTLETRMGHLDLPLNVVGVIFNPSNMPLDCFTYDKIINIHKNNENGYTGFTNIFNEKYNTKDKNLYYWLFDTEKDVITLSEYKNISNFDKSKYIENMITEIYSLFYKKLLDDIINNIKRKSINDLVSIKHLISKYELTLPYQQNMELNIEKNILHKIKDTFLQEVEVKTTDINDTLKEKPLKIPTSTLIKTKSTLIVVGKEQTVFDIDDTIQPICHHHLSWMNIGKIPSKNTDQVNQAVFEFVKNYVTQNEVGVYICKSCSEMVNLKKYNWEGTYVKELDEFLTTNLASKQKLHEIPKYSKYTRVIRNLEKIIEKFCYIIGLNFYIGNTNTIKLRRTTLIKDILDLVLLHTQYLRNQPKNRQQLANQNYGIIKELTNLFFFELKDDIFLTSSTDTDYYKKIKYNNIITYTTFMIMTEMNSGQLLFLKEDKRINYFIYNKVGDQFLRNLFLRVGKNEKIPVNKISLLGYTIFYMTGMLVYNYIWLWDYNNKETNPINVQKMCIHTLVDLINTLFEANLADSKNFQYEIIVNRFRQKIKTIYSDKLTLENIKKNNDKNIKVTDGKYSFISKKDKFYNINDYDLTNIEDIFKNKVILSECNIKREKLNIKPDRNNNTNYNLTTNCPDGKFHQWIFKDNNLICSLCDTNLEKVNETKNNDEIIKKIKTNYLKELSNTYCVSGDYHQPNEKNICKLCSKDLNNIKYSNNELYEMERNLNKLNKDKFVQETENIYNKYNKKQNVIENINNSVSRLISDYKKDTDNKLNNYIDDFIDILTKNVGNKIKINNSNVYLSDTIYIINNDYLGNPIREPIMIPSSANKIKIEYNHEYFKTDVIYYIDKTTNVTVYYSNMNKNYIGYYKNGKYNSYKSNTYLQIKMSLRDILLNLGLESLYFNVNYINDKYKHMDMGDVMKDRDMIFKNVIRNRVNNLKTITTTINSVIEQVKYKKGNNNKIVNKYNKLIKDINLTDNSGKNRFFKYLPILDSMNIMEIDKNIKFKLHNYNFDTNILNSMNNTDNIIIYFIINNLIKLIENNKNDINLTLLLIDILYNEFNKYFIPNDIIEIRQFDALVIMEPAELDESLKPIGNYNDLVNVNDIDEQHMAELEYDAREEMDAIDIPDYDDEDEYMDGDPDDDAVEGYMALEE